MSNIIQGGWNDKNGSSRHTGGNGGGSDLEARVARLETHVEYIRRDLDVMTADLKEVHSDLTSIKRRMAYLGGAGFVVAAIFAWVINNRFDEIVKILTKVAG
ncbi:hypothetical protein [Pseudomonas urmiensis]|uniref:hypothetical protein n=1 Tax=Pseudomonas urmiensis TaxID=2745493 RepID=UPI001CED193D|nr:hypothetical protein [Pseudomonas urmiensis]